MAEGFLPQAREDFLELMQPYMVIYPTEETAWRYGQLSRFVTY
jgi:hypothetical protein